MTQFWSTESAPMCMQMNKVKAEALLVFQVGFMLYNHMHISISTHICMLLAQLLLYSSH